MSKINKKKTGSTLIEVLIAIGIVGLVITAIMLSITYSVKNSAEARYREVATQLAQDGMEVVVLRRNVESWSNFSTTSNDQYCLPDNSTQFGDLANASFSNCGVQIENRTYYRYVDKSVAGGVVTATVVVKWKSDSGQDFDVQVTQQFHEASL